MSCRFWTGWVRRKNGKKEKALADLLQALFCMKKKNDFAEDFSSRPLPRMFSGSMGILLVKSVKEESP